MYLRSRQRQRFVAEREGGRKKTHLVEEPKTLEKKSASALRLSMTEAAATGAAEASTPEAVPLSTVRIDEVLVVEPELLERSGTRLIS